MIGLMVPAYAVPIVLNYEGIVDGTDIASAVDGDSFLISMIFDNGGSSLISESWSASDFVSISVSTTSGYSLFSDTYTGGTADVQTDAFGALSTLNIDPIQFSGSDVNGQTFFEIYLNGAPVSVARSTIAAGAKVVWA